MAGPAATRRFYTVAAALVAAAGVFAVVSALGLGDRGAPKRVTAALAKVATYNSEAPHVLSSYTLYPVQDSAFAPSPPTVSPPMSPAQFVAPINSYRRYAVAQLDGMLSQIRRLEQALAGGDRAGAEEAWRGAYDRYLHLGAVYLVGPVAALNDEIDGIADGLPGGVSNPRFAGLHRIEYGLWGGLAPQSLEPWAQRLEQAVRKLRARLGHVVITPLEYATRAHEILEDAQRDLLSGADVPWSGEGVLATEAGLEATEEILSTMHIYLFTEDGENERAVGPPAATELAALRAVLGSLAAAHGGRLPKNGQLTQHQAELLDGTLGGALEALAEIPGVLEAEPRPRVVPIPPRDARSDP